MVESVWRRIDNRMSLSNKRRKGISAEQRFRILKRDGFRCTYCGVPASEARLEIDHKLPFSAGGTNNDENLVAACFHCNAGKGPKANPINRMPRNGSYGGRPKGPIMPCGWCGIPMTSAQMRAHFVNCPKRPEAKPEPKQPQYDYQENS